MVRIIEKVFTPMQLNKTQRPVGKCIKCKTLLYKCDEIFPKQYDENGKSDKRDWFCWKCNDRMRVEDIK